MGELMRSRTITMKMVTAVVVAVVARVARFRCVRRVGPVYMFRLMGLT